MQEMRLYHRWLSSTWPGQEFQLSLKEFQFIKIRARVLRLFIQTLCSDTSTPDDNFQKWSCVFETGDTDHRKVFGTRKLGLGSLQHVGVIFTLTHNIDILQLLLGSKKKTVVGCIVVFPSYYERKCVVTAKSKKQMKYAFTFPPGEEGNRKGGREKKARKRNACFITSWHNMWPSVLANCE